MKVTGVDILTDDIIGQGGFLAIRRLRMRNVRADGSRFNSRYWNPRFALDPDARHSQRHWRAGLRRGGRPCGRA